MTAILAACATSGDDVADQRPAVVTAANAPALEETPVTDPTAGATAVPAADAAFDDSTTPTIPASTTSTPAVAESVPVTTVETTNPTQTDGQPDPNCRRVTDFDAPDEGWFVVDDGVMGGRSGGALSIADSIMTFNGQVTTAGGGFTSVRYRLVGGELAGSTALRIRMRSDERTYGVTLEDNAEVGQRSVSHRAEVDVADEPDSDGWTTAIVTYDSLRTSVFGRAVEAPPFDPDFAREIGIIIADGVDGSFSLEVDWIDACS